MALGWLRSCLVTSRWGLAIRCRQPHKKGGGKYTTNQHTITLFLFCQAFCKFWLLIGGHGGLAVLAVGDDNTGAPAAGKWFARTQ